MNLLLTKIKSLKLYKILLVLVSLNFLHSCSLFAPKRLHVPSKNLVKEQQNSLDQLMYLSDLYINTLNKKIFIDRFSKKYLSKLVYNLYENNQYFFENLKCNHQSEICSNINFIILNDESPFHFSLPNKNIILSKGLLQKYIKFEGLLASIISIEMIKISKFLYRKRIIIPKGYITTEEIMNYNRLLLEQKVEINKWAFNILNNADFDNTVFLSWIQIQNKNSLDFAFQTKQTYTIAREESYLKKFMIDKKVIINSVNLKNSPKDFYKFIKIIKSYK